MVNAELGNDRVGILLEMGMFLVVTD